MNYGYKPENSSLLRLYSRVEVLKSFRYYRCDLYCLHLFGAFWIVIRIYVRFFDSLYLTEVKKIEISEYYDDDR